MAKNYLCPHCNYTVYVCPHCGHRLSTGCSRIWSNFDHVIRMNGDKQNKVYIFCTWCKNYFD